MNNKFLKMKPTKNSLPNTTRTNNTTSSTTRSTRSHSTTSLSKRTVEKNYTDAPRPLAKKTVSGVVEVDYKIKSRNIIERVEVMPLGPEGYETDWNPKGLNAKELLQKRYSQGNKYSAKDVFGYFYTPYTPKSPDGDQLPRKIFKVAKGYDIAVSITTSNKPNTISKNSKTDDTISAGRFLPYTKLAPKLDEIADRMVSTNSIDQKVAVHRIAGDIIRVGSGDTIKGKYTAEEWHHLSEFAMVIRADKARAPKATRYYIDTNIRDYSTSFQERFGSGVDSIYEGAPKGGAKKLQAKQKDYKHLPTPELTDTISDQPPCKSKQSKRLK